MYVRPRVNKSRETATAVTAPTITYGLVACFVTEVDE